jgi:hypothetical protein
MAKHSPESSGTPKRFIETSTDRTELSRTEPIGAYRFLQRLAVELSHEPSTLLYPGIDREELDANSSFGDKNSVWAFTDEAFVENALSDIPCRNIAARSSWFYPTIHLCSTNKII